MLARLGEQDDGVFDWMIVLEQQRKEREALKEMDRELREQRHAKSQPTKDNVGLISTASNVNAVVSMPNRVSGAVPNGPDRSSLLPNAPSVPLGPQPSSPARENRLSQVHKSPNPPADGLSPKSNRNLQSFPPVSAQAMDARQSTPVAPPAKKKKWWRCFICGRETD